MMNDIEGDAEPDVFENDATALLICRFGALVGMLCDAGCLDCYGDEWAIWAELDKRAEHLRRSWQAEAKSVDQAKQTWEKTKARIQRRSHFW